MQRVQAAGVCSRTWNWRKEQGRGAVDLSTWEDMLRNVEFFLVIRQLKLRELGPSPCSAVSGILGPKLELVNNPSCVCIGVGSLVVSRIRNLGHNIWGLVRDPRNLQEPIRRVSRMVKAVIFRDKPDGHSDQVPYILIWQDMIENPPPWLIPFLPPKAGPTEILALWKAEKETDSMPQTPLYPVFQDSSPEDLILPPPFQALPPPSAPPLETPGEGVPVCGPAVGTCGQTHQMAPPLNVGPADSTALPLHAIGPPDKTDEQLILYWPFSTSDLYNWKTPNANFSDNPRDLIGLLDTVLCTHQPTWEDCQQLLQVLFTTEERTNSGGSPEVCPGRGQTATQNPDLINAAFPLSHPTWDYNSAEGKERLRVYRQTLMAGLMAAVRKPTNLAKVYDVRQGKDESPAAFLERVIEAFRQYTPMNPEAPETKAAIIMAFVNQATPDIKKKLQRVERLGEKSLQDLVIVAERVYNNRESPEEQQTKLSDQQTRNLAKILLATTMETHRKDGGTSRSWLQGPVRRMALVPLGSALR
ncbi:unnamed protein product [Nyctereutes procyonoides]|uniref:(raccoon dog) hypothetical protein n=1 Tax=Nyctereutes procyonoides TaxID=34880 RepID=A0A811YZP6_NYCPR|nr:unnamed protein product [Nyctereutes procyonoides]